jgi:ribosomal protein S18 acetylase RimI-like enzyme
MGIWTSISRLAHYYKRNGSVATCRRASLALNRTLFSNRMVLFYCDLSRRTLVPTDLPSSLNVERKRNETEVSPVDRAEMISFWNSKLADLSIKERFGRGASLWMIKSGGRMAGYGWTLQGRTIEPHYYHLGPNDVHLFDFYVFPQYRGQGMNPLLVNEILHNLTAEGLERAFIEAAEWNHAQLVSLGKTPFQLLGRASKFTIFRHTIICWDESGTAHQEQECKLKSDSVALGREASSIRNLRL